MDSNKIYEMVKEIWVYSEAAAHGHRGAQLTVSLVILEKQVTQLFLVLPVWVWRCRHDPLPVQPDPIGLGVHPEAHLQQVELIFTQLCEIFQ